ncbi:MAG: hypothetical protein PHQ62_03530 [Clostridia bacterium]|nr:hypothetical protein [Clostridia bacterium]
MLSQKTIRQDLKNIRYYYSRKDTFDELSLCLGDNAILEKIENYRRAVRSAPPKLYDLYALLYLQNNTQYSLSQKLGYTIEHISRVNSQLIKFLQKNLDNKEDVKYD